MELYFGENSWHSSIIFRLQKKVIRIMEGFGNRVSCRSLFKKFQILPLNSQYILSLLMFVVQNKTLFFKQTLKITTWILDKEIIYTFLKQT